MISNTAKKISLDKNGLKELLKNNNLSYEELIERFETDLKWNYMIFQIYKNKISLNTAEIENKLQSKIENLESLNDEKIELLKEEIVNSEKEKKLKMFSNMHFSNIERSIQINFL